MTNPRLCSSALAAVLLSLTITACTSDTPSSQLAAQSQTLPRGLEDADIDGYPMEGQLISLPVSPEAVDGEIPYAHWNIASRPSASSLDFVVYFIGKTDASCGPPKEIRVDETAATVSIEIVTDAVKPSAVECTTDGHSLSTTIHLQSALSSRRIVEPFG